MALDDTSAAFTDVSVRYADVVALEPSDIERGWVLACQARPSSADPIEIDFDAEY